MDYRQQICLFVMLAYAGGITTAFSLPSWSQPQRRQQQPVRQRIGTVGKQWGRGNLPQPQPVELPCDGSPEITKACDTFCQSIGARGACVLTEKTCGCTRKSPSASAPQVPANSGPAPVSPQAPPTSGTGIHVVSAPDLSPENSSRPANGGSTQQGVTPEVSVRHLRSRRSPPLEAIIENSTKDTTTHTCTKESCAATCKKQGYDACASECIGLSCYCRCPSLDKAPATVKDPLSAVQEATPENVEMSAFRPPQ